MLGSKIISNSYSRFKEAIKSFYNKILGLKDYYADLKYKFHNLKETNFELGLEHLHKKNLNDALLRFKFVDKFLDPNHKEANYWLGWTYYLKNNYSKALMHLEKSSSSDKIGLKNFLENYKNIFEIPDLIWKQYRNLIAKSYINSFDNDKNINLPYSFAKEALKQINDLPENYNILELGSNIGLVGYELRKRFPDNFNLTGVEISPLMNELKEIYYQDISLYDQIFDISIPQFLKQNTNNFEIVLSFCGFSFTKNLKNYFDEIYILLNKNGYFALCLPVSDATNLSLESKEYFFNVQEIKGILISSKFNILSDKEFMLAENLKYCMFVCKKN